jgi:hypothetical protein
MDASENPVSADARRGFLRIVTWRKTMSLVDVPWAALNSMWRSERLRKL